MAESQLDSTTRSASPSPSLSPTTGSSNYAGLDRSVSGSSSFTSFSCNSTNHDGSTIDLASKRRGYTRPQATVFADSARNRDSVMSLGTITHLQYYFARTGLLDGKGAQLARERKEGEEKAAAASRHEPANPVSSQNLSFLDPNRSLESGVTSPFLTASEMSHSSNPEDEPDPLSLPPTYSTYKQKPHFVPPPPSMSVLRRELREALEDAKKVLQAQDTSSSHSSSNSNSNTPEIQPPSPASPSRIASSSTEDLPPTQGWHEIEGLHILDLLTLAIRAAKNYYTTHDQPNRLYSICSERILRTDLYRVLEVLKRIGARNFAGGYRPREVREILNWIEGIETLITRDEKAEQKEQEKRESWLWLNGNCAGHEREREWVFLKSFEPAGCTIPVWTELPDIPSNLEPTPQLQPTPFLSSLRTGMTLIKLHNELVRNSWRPFGEIKSWHTDTNKPYRCMENLRFWIKAAQLRFEVKLEVDVSGVVNDRSAEAWTGFDAAVLKWTRAVREELTSEWREHKSAVEGSGDGALGANGDGLLGRPPVLVEPGPEIQVS